MRKSTICIAALLFVWLIPRLLNAQPTIHGQQTGILGPGSYIVDGDFGVPAGQTLTIRPGTTFYFTGHYTFYVYGLLNAVGNEDSLIYFIRQQAIEEHRWGGIRFQSGASDGCILNYCIIDNCKNLTFPNYYGAGIYSDGVDVTIQHTRISNCLASSGGGLYATGAQIQMDHCQVIKNEAGNGGGIYLLNSDGAEIHNSLIARNKATST
jgi:hypothetical protein